MKRVTGIGGIFFKSRDPQALAAWYQAHLGIPVQAWGGAVLSGAAPDEGPDAGVNWCPFAQDTAYFDPSPAPYMVNYRVDDLDALLTALRAEGVQVVDHVEASEHGKFGWAFDPDGRKFELWEPPKA